MSDKFMRVALPVLVAITGALPGVAVAQETSARQDDEIIVTAQRREERLQDVPIAVTALTQDSLETQGVDSVRELMRVVPSLTMRQFPGDNTSATINLRGLVTADNLISRDPAVGTYIDGVYLGRATGGNVGLFDVARVEVLRGPQGTLFGRNTTGGAINIVSNAPADEFGGQVTAGFGNFGLWNGEGVVNLPVTDNAALRLGVRHSEHEGYAQSSITGRELNDDKSDFFKVAFRLNATEDLTVDLGYDYWHTANGGQWTSLVKVVPGGRLALEYDLGDDGLLNGSRTLTANPYSTHPASTHNGLGFTAEVWGLNGTISWNIGPGTLKSITAYRELYRDNHGNDLDATPASGIQQKQGFADQRQTSQELQYLGEAFGGRLDYIFGYYHFEESGEDRSRSAFLPLVADCLTPGTGGCNGDSITGAQFGLTDQMTNGFANNTSESVFGQIGFDVTDKLKLNAGVRFVQDRRELTLTSRNVLATSALETTDTADIVSCVASALGAVPAGGCAYTFKPAEFDYTPFTVGLDYRVSDDMLLYAKYSRGFGAGGFNIRASVAAAVDAFGPEEVNTAEFGIKSDLFDRHLRFNAAYYFTDYKDIQLTAIVGSGVTPSTTIKNAGDGEISGLEIESVLHLGNLDLTGTYSYTDAKYTRIDPAVPPTVVILASNFQLTPENIYSVAADYTLPMGESEVRLHAGYDWRDDTYFASVPPADPANIQAAYGLWNARITLALPKSLEVSVWGENLADEQYIISTTDFISAGIGWLVGYPGDPRTYGATLKYRF